jgi:hypothetical protein
MGTGESDRATTCTPSHGQGTHHMGYMFGFLTIEDNTSASPEVVEQVLEALDKFSRPSLADTTIRNWIRSVHEDVVLMVRRYEIELISLSWGAPLLAC